MTCALRTLAAATAVLTLACGGVAGTAAANPRPAPSAPASAAGQRSLGLAGASNARDIGGYRTADGHTVRYGLVFRSNALSKLTLADLADLQHRDVRVIDDLRTAFERAIAPDRIPAGAVEYWNDVLGRAPIGMNTYRAFIVAPGADQAFGNVLRDIVHTNGAVLYHCSAGKDRTGWATAVLLTILGVDRNTVRSDYLLSNYYLHAPNSVARSELDTAFAAADQQYGNFDNYVHQGLGLTDIDIAALRAKLLV